MKNPKVATPVFIGVAVILIAITGTTGCGGDGADGLSKAATSLGLTCAPALPPEVIDLACDTSSDTPCTPVSLAQTLDRVLPYAASRSGSHVRLWQIGRDVSDVRLLADEVVPPPAKGKKAAKSQGAKWMSSTRALLLKAAEPAFAGRPARRSPLFEGITKIGLAEVPGIGQRIQIVLTDGLEYSTFSDWECAEMIPTAALAKQLHAEHVLTPGVLKDTKIFLTFADPSRVARNRCRSSVARLTTITDAWRQLLREAGASDVVITTGVAPLGDRPTE